MVIHISPENGNDERDESTSLRRCLTSLSLGNGMTAGRSRILASSDEPETHMTAMSPPADSPSPIAGRFHDKLKNTSPSPPPVSIAIKRRRFFTSVIEEADKKDYEQNSDAVLVGKKMLARKLGDEFDRIASEDTLEMTKSDLNSNKISEKENVDEADANMCDNLQERLKSSRVSRSSPSSPVSRKKICSPRLAMGR